ncbi:MAG: hypothetical protein WAV98_01260 [Minisyncoccia bacterium]
MERNNFMKESFDQWNILKKQLNETGRVFFVHPREIWRCSLKEKNDEFHHKIETENKVVWAKLTQTRVISTKRLFRKVDILNQELFDKLVSVWKSSL